jgi:hypothetical protein
MLVVRWEASQRAARCIAAACSQLAAGFDPLAAGSCEVRDGVLWLTVGSAAQSAKLRQAVPRLLSLLGADGLPIYEIKTRVQPSGSCDPDRGAQCAADLDQRWLQPSSAVADTIGELALTVQDSPLKNAVERLAATLRKRARRQL